MFFSNVQLWWLVSLHPVWVQRRTVPHSKDLFKIFKMRYSMSLNSDGIIFKFRFQKSHFTPKKGYCTRTYVYLCMKNFFCKYLSALFTKTIIFLIWLFIIYLRSSQRRIFYQTYVKFQTYLWMKFFILEGPFGPLLAPPEGLRAPGVHGVNPGGRPQESGGDSKAI